MAVISPEQRLANVQSCLLAAVQRLRRRGLSMKDAERLLAQTRTMGWSLRLRNPEWSDCCEACAALAHWRELKALHAAGRLEAIEDDGLPF